MSPSVQQKTLKNAISCSGIGLHTGARVSITLNPAEPNTGIQFKRTDITGGQAVILADWRRVVDSRLCSAITNDDGVTVRTIEHLMAAFAGIGIDNAQVEINGPEVPIMDGSAAPFVFLVECAGIVAQGTPRRILKVLKPITVRDGVSSAALEPCGGFAIDFDIEFSSPAVARQEFRHDFTEAAFKNDIARARTFGFEHEVAALRAEGMLLGGSLDNAIVVSGAKVLNDSGLRYGDEFVRHKVLDSIGDLFLAGMPIHGRFRGLRSGHAMNHKLLAALFADTNAWTVVPDRGSSQTMPLGDAAAGAAEPQRVAAGA